MKIFLVGMPGSGKSTLGRQVADHFKFSFFDLDAVIEQSEGLTIPQIFERHGEVYFRSVESQCLRNVTSQEDRFVIATGGGAPCFHDNMNFINNEGLSVFLDVSVPELVKRLLSENLELRPIYKDMSVAEVEQKLLEQHKNRFVYYEQAQHKISKDTISVADIVSLVQPTL
ncbi:MAG: shikimate kinase [Bacteroidota bacterium]